MRVRTAAPLALAVVVVVGAPAYAKSKPKPLTKTYSVTLAPQADLTTAAGSGACSSKAAQEGVNISTTKISVTGPGTLAVKMTGFSGDWDLAVRDLSGSTLTEGGGTDTPGFATPAAPADETLKYKYKKTKPVSFNLVACNYLGTPNATITYTYTYA
jgi:type 1 fimbria pilin